MPETTVRTFQISRIERGRVCSQKLIESRGKRHFPQIALVLDTAIRFPTRQCPSFFCSAFHQQYGQQTDGSY